jgi:hypothetical protein
MLADRGAEGVRTVSAVYCPDVVTLPLGSYVRVVMALSLGSQGKLACAAVLAGWQGIVGSHAAEARLRRCHLVAAART